ncbi:MAG TPA: ABC transporter ATP-binding protein, partial [Bellilinea sp.]|nr:ABC transporter ATP-binding protein [Bellilinea sp.]
IGPNGAGKSSLLNCLSGVYRPNSGRIFFSGRNITSLAPHRRAILGIGRTFQGIQTYPTLTVRENILAGFHCQMKSGLFAGLLYWPLAQKEECIFTGYAEIIEFLELEELRHIQVGELGYGIRKRVDLGRALALRPKVLIMDEPMAGMNMEEKADLARFILDIRSEHNIPIILVEHDMEVVMDISDRILVMQWGKPIAYGNPAEIRCNQKVINAYLGEELA